MQVTRGEARLDAALSLLDGIAGAESRLYALRARALADAVRGAHEADGAPEGCTAAFLPLHVAGTLTVRQSTAQTQLDDARHLVVLLPETLRALEAGWLRVQAARVLVEETRGMAAHVCAAVEADVLPWAPDRPAGDVRRRVRQVLLRLQDVAEAERRRRRAVAGRAVASSPLPDGMAGVWATMPAGAERLFTAALRQVAERVTEPGDDRTRGQREADVLAALPGLVLDVLTTAPPDVRQWWQRQGFRTGGAGRELTAVVLVPHATALGGDEPAELVGHGPVTAAHARALLGGAAVRTATVDATGRVLAVGGVRRSSGVSGTGEVPGDRGDGSWRAALGAPLVETPTGRRSYRPTVRLRRLVQVRDRRCIGPGCTVPASRCDVEHRIPWPHGPTTPGNTAPVSRRCHRAKQAGWRYRRVPDGTTTWSAPGGRRYRVPPDD